mgnify:CR=1 FL=1
MVAFFVGGLDLGLAGVLAFGSGLTVLEGLDLLVKLFFSGAALGAAACFTRAVTGFLACDTLAGQQPS